MAEEKPQESDLDVMSQLSERMKGVGKEAKSLNLKLSRFLEAQKQQAKSLPRPPPPEQKPTPEAPKESPVTATIKPINVAPEEPLYEELPQLPPQPEEPAAMVSPAPILPPQQQPEEALTNNPQPQVVERIIEKEISNALMPELPTPDANVTSNNNFVTNNTIEAAPVNPIPEVMPEPLAADAITPLPAPLPLPPAIEPVAQIEPTPLPTPEQPLPDLQIPMFETSQPKIEPPPTTVPDISNVESVTEIPEINVNVPEIKIPEISTPKLEAPTIPPVSQQPPTSVIVPPAPQIPPPRTIEPNLGIQEPTITEAPIEPENTEQPFTATEQPPIQTEIPKMIAETEAKPTASPLTSSDENLINISKSIDSLALSIKQYNEKLTASIGQLADTASEILKMLPALKSEGSTESLNKPGGKTTTLDNTNMIGNYRERLGLTTKGYVRNTIFPGNNSIT